MTAQVSDYKNVVYHREYDHDVPQQDHLASRVAMAALPFFSLIPQLRFPLSLAMGSLRVWNHSDHLGRNIAQQAQLVVAIIALAAAIFCHPIGQIIVSMQDIILDVKFLITECATKEEAIYTLFKIFNNLLYLALVTWGGLELSIVCLALQLVMNLIDSVKDFKQGRWIEGCAHLLMAAVRLEQTYTQCQLLKRNWEIEDAIKRFKVGELHEKWQFPSDHLPVGIEVNGVRIISWNVLNNAYIDWVTEKDSQGLNGSLISELNKPVGDTGLTMRDLYVADLVKDMMAHGHVIALQECGEPFLQCLQQKLPSSWSLVRSFETARKDQDVILYDKTKVEHLSSHTNMDAYPSSKDRPLQQETFAANGMNLNLFNAHIPGDPTLPGRDEFARYVASQHHAGDVTIALGDNNFERDEMIAAYRHAGFSDFSIHSPWKTNIDPATKESKGIDHLFVVGTENSRDLRPDEVLHNLEDTIHLLNTNHNK